MLKTKVTEHFYTLRSILGENVFKIKIYTENRNNLEDKSAGFDIKITPIDASTTHPIIILRGSFVGTDDSKCRVNDFQLPVEMIGYRVGTFVLHQLYKCIQPGIREQVIITGRLPKEKAPESRDSLYKKLINYKQSEEAIFKSSSKDADGWFEGRLHDVGESWRKSLVIIEHNEMLIKDD